MADEQVTRFYSVSSRVLGVIAILIAGYVAVSGIVDPGSGIAAWVVALMFLVGVLTWCALLRQTMVLTDEALVLNNLFDTVTIPLTSVEAVVTSQVVAIRADGKRYLSAAIGRSRRQQRRDSRPRGSGPGRSGFGALGGGLSLSSVEDRFGATVTGPEHYESLVEQQILAHRDRARDAGQVPTPVERRWAWPEIALTALTAVVSVVLFVVA